MYTFWSYVSFNFIKPTEKKKEAYDKLPVAEKEKIRAILFIMGRFSISWEAYYELTQQDADLPRSYLVEGCQAEVDSHWNVTKTPGEHPGAELPLRELLKREIQEHVSTRKIKYIKYVSVIINIQLPSVRVLS